MKRIKLFGLNGAMCDLNNILNKLDEDYNDNIQWINDCLKAAKIRAEDAGTLVPVTPKGRPKTRLFLKKRALQLELVNRLNFSHKSGASTPKNNKSVSVNVTPHYLNKSVSLKKKLLAKAIRDSGKRAKEKNKNNQPDPIRTVLFKSPDVGTKKPVTTISGDVEGATTNAAQEVKKTTGKTRGRPPKPKVAEKAETKPVVRKGRPRLPLIDEKLKGNLESLVDNLLSPIKNPPPKTTGRPAREKPMEVPVFKSPMKEVKSKIDTGLDAVKRKKAATKKLAVKNISEEKMVFEECETVEVCDKSLQVSLPSMARLSGNLMADLNPVVRLVDIGIGLSNAIKNKQVKVSVVADSTGEYYSISDNNCPKSAERSKALPNIYSSTPAHKNPNHLLMLQKLNLTRISMGGSPPGRTLDRSEVSYEVPQPRPPLHPTTDAIVIDDSCTGTQEVAEKATPYTGKDGEEPRQAAIAKVAPTVNGIPSAACNPKSKKLDHPRALQCKPYSQNNQVSATGCTPAAAIVTQNIESESKALSTKSAAPPLMNVNCGKGPVSNSPSVEIVEVSSYEMTPARKNKRFLPSTTDDYNIRDLDSDDSTDDEDRPRKVIPAWARSANLNRALIRQSQIPLHEIHKMFESVVHENLNLKEIFSQKNQFRKRTSSACWDHPPPKKPKF